jgi:hypothetical protein
MSASEIANSPMISPGSACARRISPAHRTAAPRRPNRMSPTTSSGLTYSLRDSPADADRPEEAGDSDRKIHKKYEPPVQVADDQAAGDRPEHRADQPGMATKLMARMSSDLSNVRTSVSRPTGTIMAPPQPCRMRQATRRWMSLGDAAEQRAEREEADRGGKHPARAETIGHPAADRNEHREAQRVARQHRLHAERASTPSACDMTGTAVFRIVVSSDSMKNATATSHGKSRLLGEIALDEQHTGIHHKGAVADKRPEAGVRIAHGDAGRKHRRKAHRGFEIKGFLRVAGDLPPHLGRIPCRRDDQFVGPARCERGETRVNEHRHQRFPRSTLRDIPTT